MLAEWTSEVLSLSLSLSAGVRIAYAMAVAATLWCSRLAAGLILRRLPDDQDFRDMYYLLIYPCVMVYSAIAILTVY